MTPDIFCMMCKNVFPGYEEYGVHVGDCAVENVESEEDD